MASDSKGCRYGVLGNSRELSRNPEFAAAQAAHFAALFPRQARPMNIDSQSIVQQI